MKNFAAAALLAALSAAAAAQPEQWVFIVSGDTREYHAQRGSVVYSTSTVSFVIRSRDPRGGDITLSRAITTRADCQSRAGQVVFASLDMKQIRFRADFAFDAGNVGSVIGQSLCEQLLHEDATTPAPAPVSRIL